jgi:hypothetical protein
MLDKQRRYDIDSLRVFAVSLLIPFHTAQIFNNHDFYVRNSELSAIGMDIFTLFVHQWHMPLFFFVSGAATWFALGFRTKGQYSSERAKRLLIPLIFGTLALIPPQVYCMRLTGSSFGRSSEYVFQGSYFQFYPQFFDGIAPGGNFEYGHLWFLLYLFVFSLIALPIFMYLRKEAGKDLVSRLADVCEKPGAILLLGIPFAIIQAALRAKWPGFQNLYDDWANFFFYITFFIYGYVLVSDERFKKAIEGRRNVSLAMGAALMSLIYIWRWGAGEPASDYSPAWLLYMIIHGFNSWFWVIAILGFGSKYLSFSNRILQYSSEAALPYYVLHQTAIVVIGYYVIRWDMSVMGKFSIICILTMALIAVTYEAFVKRTNLTRSLFGMKGKKHKPIEQKIHMAGTELEEA